MKSRLSSTIWLLNFWIAAALVGVLGLGYYAAQHPAEGGALPGGASPALLGAIGLAVLATLSIIMVLSKRVLKPVGGLAKFSERLVAGDARARAEVEGSDEFAFIAENFNRSAAKVAQAVTNQQAQDSLQRSITDLLNTINQVARGDLTIRGKVTNDALGNVIDSVNFMLDNFTKVLERVRKAAIDVSTSANQILEAADDMTAGATQQDQEITNTSSAVEELTVSMKQVSNNAEASAEAARRALDAAEQGNRAVRDTLEGMQRIRASVQATAKKIKSLGDRSLEISEIINVINDITEQTNLLALNAAIEAARAGDAGRGFAVIVMEEGTREVEVGAGLADQAGKALEAISSVVRQSAELVQEISLASKQQVRGTEGVANAMQIISNITRQTSQGARQTSRTVEQLVHMSEQLNEALAQFRVATGGAQNLPGEGRPELVSAAAL